MQELSKYCPVCREWVFHNQGLCPKCNHIFPMDLHQEPKEEQVFYHKLPKKSQNYGRKRVRREKRSRVFLRNMLLGMSNFWNLGREILVSGIRGKTTITLQIMTFGVILMILSTTIMGGRRVKISTQY